MDMDMVLDMDIGTLLEHCRSSQYYADFVDNGWDDPSYLLSLTDTQLVDVTASMPNIKPGHVQRFLHYMREFRKTGRPVPLALLATAPDNNPPPKPAAVGAGSPVTHLGIAYPVDSPPLATGGGSGGKSKAARLQRIEQLDHRSAPTHKKRAAGGAAAGENPAKRAAAMEEKAWKAAAKAEARAEAMAKAEARQRQKEKQKELEAAAKAKAKAEKAIAEAEKAIKASHEAGKSINESGMLLVTDIAAGVGGDLRKSGAHVWLSTDERLGERWGRSGWSLADFRVRITMIDAEKGTFNGKAVPPGKFDVSSLPLSHVAKVEMSEREWRAAEQGAKRDALRQDAMLRSAQLLQTRLEALPEDAQAAQAARRLEYAKQRSEKEARMLNSWGAVDRRSSSGGGEGGEDDDAAAGERRIVARRLHASNRVSSTDLPEDLRPDAEAVEVWAAAVQLKRTKSAADQWVRGWRLKMVPRQSFGGGADLYVRAPDQSPEAMPDNHSVSKGPRGVQTIRSFVALEAKLRERMLSGDSSGLVDARKIALQVYHAPASRPQWPHVRVDLQVIAGTALPSSPALLPMDKES